MRLVHLRQRSLEAVATGLDTLVIDVQRWILVWQIGQFPIHSNSFGQTGYDNSRDGVADYNSQGRASWLEFTQVS